MSNTQMQSVSQGWASVGPALRHSQIGKSTVRGIVAAMLSPRGYVSAGVEVCALVVHSAKGPTRRAQSSRDHWQPLPRHLVLFICTQQSFHGSPAACASWVGGLHCTCIAGPVNCTSPPEGYWQLVKGFMPVCLLTATPSPSDTKVRKLLPKGLFGKPLGHLPLMRMSLSTPLQSHVVL